MRNGNLKTRERVDGALWGLFLGDALAMPVHWYYDRQALHNDYGEVRDLIAPRNPHPGSILHRSKYEPHNEEADILHDQARYWGQHGVHYHQHLAAGENTLNLRLVQLLLAQLHETGRYDADEYLERMVVFLREPNSHNDTYVEEWARAFFQRRAQGLPLRKCAIEEKHIGGLGGAIALLLWHHEDPENGLEVATEHLELTHRGTIMRNALRAVADVLGPVLAGKPLTEAIDGSPSRGRNPMAKGDFKSWAGRDDYEVIGRILSPACYVQDSVPAVLYLARKYADQPEEGLIINTMLGGENCHRGMVLGALLGAAHGRQGWPKRWREGLLYRPHSFGP
jgi:ADP-ribosylglycohydrolase